MGDDTGAIGGRLLRALHVSSLDAVLVLMTYAWAMTRLTGADPPWGVFPLLGVGVWLGYVADRRMDVRRDPHRAETTLRHRFHRRHERALKRIWWMVCCGLIAAGFRVLPLEALLTGGLVALGAAGYSLRPRVVGGPRRGWAIVRKRIGTIGLLTLAGVWWWPAWPGAHPERLFAGMAIFALSSAWEIWRLHHGARAPTGFAETGLAVAICGLGGAVLGGLALPGAACLVACLLVLGRAKVKADPAIRAPLADIGLVLGWLLLGGAAALR
jgi:4-hydroxybenzoate polyprenyltransferase